MVLVKYSDLLPTKGRYYITVFEMNNVGIHNSIGIGNIVQVSAGITLDSHQDRKIYCK
jgi:hypothetical protein